MSEINLLPCPFCGSEAVRVDIPSRDPRDGGDQNAGGSYIHCLRCEVSGSIHFGEKERLYEQWNERIAEPASYVGIGPQFVQDALQHVYRAMDAMRRKGARENQDIGYNAGFNVSADILEAALKDVRNKLGFAAKRLDGPEPIIFDAAEAAAPSPATPEAEGQHKPGCPANTDAVDYECDCPEPASPPAAQPSPERIQIVHGLQLLLDKFYRFHAGAMNRHEVSAFQICKNELSAFMESVKSGSLNQNVASQAAAQEQKPVAWLIQGHPPKDDELVFNEWYQALSNKPAAIPLVFASPIPALGWVKCSERMPPEGAWLIMYLGNSKYAPGNSAYRVGIAFTNRETGQIEWCSDAAIVEHDYKVPPEWVTEWMPLQTVKNAAPVAPKGET